MFPRAASRVNRFSLPKSRHAKGVIKPLVNAKTREPVAGQAQSIVEPVYLTLTPSLRRGRWDPPADKTVAILEPTVFRQPIRRDILQLCVVHHLDSLRQGSANTKTRGEVAGSGAKIRRQKGSGKARLGDAQSPMLRGGGVAFGPKPRDFSTKLPKKVIDQGMRIALSAKLREQHLGVMTRLYWPNAKTKHLCHRIDALGLRKTLFVSGEPVIHDGLERAIRNIPLVKLTTVQDINVYEIMKWERIVLDVKAVEYLEQLLKKDNVPVLPAPLVDASELPAALLEASESSELVSEAPAAVAA
ncbi:hypothetical protein D9619_003497 [Psilocybe cf. subviscida]|uniref:Large ribosomal subunit protein uL4m n=1 Tax=Psilocybe cf. subviscida TaxID=2480587 RepID=A0A8H5AZZ9_9AGAR|nr:hypothetical protein D9619_003497 [Psilocybe cf. subviscida]